MGTQKRLVSMGLGGLALFGLAVAGPVVPASAQEATTDRADVSYDLVNLNDGAEHTIHGYLRSAPCDADTAVVLLHGLSYTGEAWDVPGYSYAEILAEAGYDVLAIDRLGYGRSTLADGYNVSTFAHADMAAQLTDVLKQEYSKVVLAGHSAGGETVVQAIGLFGADADAVVPMGYHTYPDPEFLAFDWVTGDQVRALQDDYEYFMGTPEHRAEMFYTENADPQVVADDTAAAVDTPSGEILTISMEPARVAAFNVTVPVLAQLADSDRLFPVAYADFWAAQFAQAPSVTVDIVPGSGHTYMLHFEGPPAADRMVDWLGATADLPGCAVGAVSAPVASGVVASAAPEADEAVPSLPATGGLPAVVGLALLATARLLRRTTR